VWGGAKKLALYTIFAPLPYLILFTPLREIYNLPQEQEHKVTVYVISSEPPFTGLHS